MTAFHPVLLCQQPCEGSVLCPEDHCVACTLAGGDPAACLMCGGLAIALQARIPIARSRGAHVALAWGPAWACPGDTPRRRSPRMTQEQSRDCRKAYGALPARRSGPCRYLRGELCLSCWSSPAYL